MDRRVMFRSSLIALVVFLWTLMPMGFRAEQQADEKVVDAIPSSTKPTLGDSPEKVGEPAKVGGPTQPSVPAATLAFKSLDLLQTTESAIRPPTVEKYREWAGDLLALGEPTLALKMAGKHTSPAVKNAKDPLAVARELVRRGQFEFAEPLVRRLTSERAEETAVMELDVACQMGLGRMDMAMRSLRLMRSSADPKTSAFADFLQTIAMMSAARKMPGVEHNPWNVSFLPKGGAEPMKVLPDSERAKLPVDAPEFLGRWLTILPMQPNLWALLGQILYVHGETADALECFRRAKGLGYSTPLVTEYIQSLEKAEADRRTATLKQLAGDTKPAGDAATDLNAVGAGEPSSVAITESSARVLSTVGIGGVIVGLLLGQMFRRRSKA